MRSPSSLLLLLGLTGIAHSQVLDTSGNPDPNFPLFYAWYDAGPGANGGGAVTGDSVTTWADATGNLRDLVRVSTDVARQPVFDTTGAFPSVEFDGDDFIWANNAAEFGTLAGDKTIFVVARVDDFANGGYLFDSSSVAGRNAVFAGQNSAPGLWHIYAGSGQPAAGSAVPLGTWQVHSAVFGANDQRHYVDGVLQASGAEPLSDLSGLVVGARYTVSNGHVGGIAEILVYESVLPDPERQALEGYLASKYTASTIGTNYCTAVANSTGVSSVIVATGSDVAAANSLTLTGTSMPLGEFAYFVCGQAQGFVAGPGGSQGNLCIIGQLGRFNGPGQVLNSGTVGEVSLGVDLTSIPIGTGTVVQPGETWNFQLWYRDLNPTPTSNFSDAVAITFQ